MSPLDLVEWCGDETRRGDIGDGDCAAGGEGMFPRHEEGECSPVQGFITQSARYVPTNEVAEVEVYSSTASAIATLCPKRRDSRMSSWAWWKGATTWVKKKLCSKAMLAPSLIWPLWRPLITRTRCSSSANMIRAV